MKNQIQKQYEGFLNTPPLWENIGPFKMEQFILPPDNGTHILENINAAPGLIKNYVLGKRVEIFFSFLIDNSAEYDLIAKNLQIVEEKITIGEIDFLVQDTGNGEILHIEMVYKFYLYDPSLKEEVHRWIGPNRKDSLSQKIEKLQDKQLPLLYHPETFKYLRELDIDPKEIKQQVCFKAHLFVPLEMYGQKFVLVNNSCIRGYWIRFPEFDKKNYARNEFYIPKKTDWPIDPAGHDEWLIYSEVKIMIHELNSGKISPMVWMKTPEGDFRSFFVVWW